jgi:predicted DNA-binding WGR domain protein
MRRFEFEEGTSSKFWAIERRERDVTVTFGRIGAAGQEKTKSFPSEEKATHEEEKLIAEKLRKGYREVAGASPITAGDGGSTENGSARSANRTSPARATADTGSDVYFADYFGLTRVGADGKVRTVPKLWGTVLSIDADGRFGVLHKPNGIRLIVGLARMSEIGALDNGEQMHPAGAVLTRVGSPYAFQVVGLQEDGATRGRSTRDLGVESAPERDVLRLAQGDRIDLVCFEPVALDAAGNYLAWFNFAATSAGNALKGSTLCAGRFPNPDGSATTTWRAELRGPQRGRLALSIAGGVPVVCLAYPTTAKVDVVILGLDGAMAPAHRRTIDSVTLPARVGQTLVYQPDAATVVREPLEGGASVRYPLTGTQVGLGRIVARGDRWLFVPAHGESVLDLEHGGVELNRGLPAAEASTRAAAVAALAKVRELVSDAGMEAELQTAPGKRTSGGIRLSGGAPFLGTALENTIFAYLRAAGVETSVGLSLSHGGVAGRVTQAQMVDLLRYFEAHRLKLAWAGSFVGRLQPFPDGMEDPMSIEPDAEALLLWAALDEMAPGSGTNFDARLAIWTKGVPTPQQIAAKLAVAAAEEQKQTQWDSTLWNVVAGITLRRFRDDALDIWFPLAEGKLSMLSGLIKGLTWLAAEDAGARQRIASWFATLKELDFYGRYWKPLSDQLGVAPVAPKKDAKAADEDEDHDPIPPPPGIEEPTTWDALAAAWAGAREFYSAEKAKARDRAAVAGQLGIPALPPSYLEFMRRFYVLGELRKKYERDRFPYFLDLRSPDSLASDRDYFNECLASFGDIDVQLRETARALEGLLPFGSNNSRINICWDPTKINDAGEMLICFVDGDKWDIVEARTDVGYDLKEVLKYYQPGSFDRPDDE